MPTKQKHGMADEHVYCARGGRETGRPGYVWWPAEIWGILITVKHKTQNYVAVLNDYKQRTRM